MQPNDLVNFSWLHSAVVPVNAAQQKDPMAPPEPEGPRPMVELKHSPSTTQEPLQRVTQVCLGAEHGILLTDACVVFTWGDNRYGQLGREPCTLSESMQPFPVLGLINDGIVQIAAGTHHCLSLTAYRLVWAWGRNKHGQLGCGDLRDKPAPNEVKDPKGQARLKDVLTISAGGYSSIAVSLNADVWQWGEISSDFRVKTQDQGQGDQPEASSKGEPMNKALPQPVFHKDDQHSRMRQTTVSIAKTGCRVIEEGLKRFERDRIMDLVKTAKKWHWSIAVERQKAIIVPPEPEDEDIGAPAVGEPGWQSDAIEIQDAIGMLEREIQLISHEVFLLNRSLDSCEVQQKHIRHQISGVTAQGARLSAKELTVQNEAAQQGERSFDKEIAEIKGALDANHKTRTTLLEQRAETDKEKQRISYQRNERLKFQKEKVARLKLIRELERRVHHAASSDLLLEGARDISRSLEEWAKDMMDKTRPNGPNDNFVGAMSMRETEEADLWVFRARLAELAGSYTDSERAERARNVVAIVEDLVDLHKAQRDLLADKWVRHDADLTSFLGKARRPSPPRKAAEEKAVERLSSKLLSGASSASSMSLR